MAETVRPPYAPGGAIEILFERIRKVGPPKKADLGWAKEIHEAQPGAITGLLRWLGVVDAEGNIDKDVWQKLRTNQAASLADLVRKTYSELFDTVDVAAVDLATLKTGFIQAYESGAPEKPVKAFLALCKVAGIETAAKARSSPAKGAPRKAEPVRKATKVSPPAGKRSTTKQHEAPADVSINVQVVIPPEWSAEQVRERMEQVVEAARQVSGGT